MMFHMSPRPAQEPREVVTCRILPDLIKKLDEIAAADNRSRSEMIEMAVREMIARNSKKAKGK